jgi:hypothetical protein
MFENNRVHTFKKRVIFFCGQHKAAKDAQTI